MADEGKGSLYIVSTPIGNLADLTYRAVEILRKVHLIAAEDTRRSKILLNHYQIHTPLSSFHSYNQFEKGQGFVDLLNVGKDLALVSDAGTPGISDPLFHLVRLAIENGIVIYSIPGPSAVVAALTVSGLPIDRFVFEGFLPAKKRRQKRLGELAEEKRTMVFYESPHRMERTLNDLFRVFGNRQVVVARELTKLHEEVIRGNLADLAAEKGRKWRGEFTLVVSGCPQDKDKRED
ncbi:MAG: 16S rRNA (cytidine(1402)-2'-O)-methyltransferase [Nitrospinae bacterium RIFCSPLOWO2_12_FULL_47_7]|nr:MAG: 16S rRNA (cytidine(1402)-2'-O)-methyltransferase [Nitrospinae bacterium RIFCSPLOWO2_12_FULL_47_7]